MTSTTASIRPCRCYRFFTVAAFFSFVLPVIGLSQAPERPKPSGAARVAATAVSLSLGLGIGHFMLGYSKQGRVFAITQLAGLASGVAGIAMGLSAWNNYDRGFRDFIAAPLLFGGLGLYAGSRVWELIDVVARPTADNPDEQPATEAAPRIELAPVLLPERSGVALRFRF